MIISLKKVGKNTIKKIEEIVKPMIMLRPPDSATSG
jgi:hypothetical protein